MTARSLASLLAAAVLVVSLPAARAWAGDPKPAPDQPPAPVKPADEPPAKGTDGPAMGTEGPTPAAKGDEVAGPDAKTRAQVIKILDDLREEAAKIRGLAWKTKVEADLLTRPQLAKRLEEMIKDDFDPKEYDRDLKALRRLGLLTAQQDPIELTKKFLEVGIAGYYDPKTKKLYLIDGLTGDAQRPTILHELTHAIEDQYIDLEKTQDAIKKDQDKSFALKCAIEGSAETARAIYDEEHPEYQRLSQQEQLKSDTQKQLTKVLSETPSLLYVGTLLHYQIGPAFVGRWIRTTGKGGTTRAEYPSAITRLYAEMPVSEEQVLHPSKFVGENRDLPRRVSWPDDLAAAAGDGWAALESQSIGELDVEMWLDRWLGGTGGHLDTLMMASGRYFGDEAKTAAEGWDGAWMQMLEMKGDPRAYVVASAWDSPQDAVEAGNAFLAAAKKQYGDKFKSGDWVEKDGVRTSNYEDGYGLARIEVKGDEVRIVDGLPLEALDRVFAALEKAKFEKDPKDTWTRENALDATAGADWKHEKSGMAWKKPNADWTVTSTGDTASMKKGGLEVKVRVIPASVAVVAPSAIVGLASRYPDLDTKNPPLADVSVAGKESARIEFDSTLKGAEGKRHVVVVLVPMGAAQTVVVQAALDDGAWKDVSKDFEAAVAGFVVKD